MSIIIAYLAGPIVLRIRRECHTSFLYRLSSHFAPPSYFRVFFASCTTCSVKYAGVKAIFPLTAEAYHMAYAQFMTRTDPGTMCFR